MTVAVNDNGLAPRLAPLVLCLAAPVRRGLLPLAIAEAVVTMAVCRTPIEDVSPLCEVLHGELHRAVEA